MAKESKDFLLGLVRDGEEISIPRQLRLMVMLSLPAILAQFSSVMMQYIDAGMVGRLGAGPSASIGLVSTSTWIMYGFATAVCSGFSVQVAHLFGSKDFKGARSMFRQGLTTVMVFGLLLGVFGMAISQKLPFWLGGSADIASDASAYFLIFSAFLPLSAIGYAASMMLQASGNMKVPSLVYAGMCALDVVFNYFFIYVLDMGVVGAAWGTGVAETVTSIFVLWYTMVKSPDLRIVGEEGSFRPSEKTLKNAWGITGPLWLQNLVMRGAYIMGTVIVAPLGPVSIAANMFAVSAESFCYMPGYGISEAATTLVGQSLGANRKEVARKFAWIAVLLAGGTMSVLAVLMFIFAPQMMSILSNDPEVIALGAKVLRIEAFAELLYGVSIAGYGSCVGGGDTLVPSFMNFGSMWVVRIGLAAILTPKIGLAGYWIAMCIELNVRGLLYIWRLRGETWMRLKVIS